MERERKQRDRTKGWHKINQDRQELRGATGKKSAQGQTGEQTSATHTHRWRIGEPNGPTSEGSCRHCGATKEFKNWNEKAEYLINADRANLI